MTKQTACRFVPTRSSHGRSYEMRDALLVGSHATLVNRDYWCYHFQNSEVILIDLRVIIGEELLERGIYACGLIILFCLITAL